MTSKKSPCSDLFQLVSSNSQLHYIMMPPCHSQDQRVDWSLNWQPCSLFFSSTENMLKIVLMLNQKSLPSCFFFKTMLNYLPILRSLKKARNNFFVSIDWNNLWHSEEWTTGALEFGGFFFLKRDVDKKNYRKAKGWKKWNGKVNFQLIFQWPRLTFVLNVIFHRIQKILNL